jgi:capsular exopolysaccharide synthesis family protein
VLFDSRRNHVNNVETISNDMQISVLGTIPRVPNRVIKRLNDASHAGARQWRERVSESVMAVTAMLLRKLEVEGHRVIMITSAVSGEGKSTLAEQLATSVAESGRKTLLIDFDLRRPQLHHRLNASLEPGVCDALRENSDLQAVVQETSTPNLSLLTAGRGMGALLQYSANGSLSALFQKCREEFEIVLVDSSPLLPVVDGRVVGQYTDGALLTVIKDTSQVPQVESARKFLTEYGIPILGCVVTGDDNAAYYNMYANSDEAGLVARGVAATRSMSAM